MGSQGTRRLRKRRNLADVKRGPWEHRGPSDSLGDSEMSKPPEGSTPPFSANDIMQPSLRLSEVWLDGDRGCHVRCVVRGCHGAPPVPLPRAAGPRRGPSSDGRSPDRRWQDRRCRPGLVVATALRRLRRARVHSSAARVLPSDARWWSRRRSRRGGGSPTEVTLRLFGRPFEACTEGSAMTTSKQFLMSGRAWDFGS